MTVFYFLKWERERSVICCVAGAEGGSWGNETWTEVPRKADCTTSCFCPCLQFALPRRAKPHSKQDTFREERHCSRAIKTHKRAECREVLLVPSKVDLLLSRSSTLF